jgi:hypothetical protein
VETHFPPTICSRKHWNKRVTKSQNLCKKCRRWDSHFSLCLSLSLSVFAETPISCSISEIQKTSNSDLN